MYSGTGTRALPRVGFPIRTSRDQWLVSTSSGLIAAAHVLLRLLAPRHPPCALVLLIRRTPVSMSLWSFQGPRGRTPAQHENAALRLAGGARSLKTQQRDVEVDVDSRRARTSDGRSNRSSTSRAPTGVRAPVFPRKEVIQPQLPLRLPCYDFVPITSPAFDGSLPCGLGHRLQAYPTFMT